MIYDITPVPKPRMTQRDKWKGRSVVLRYNAYKDELRLKQVKLPEFYHIIFVLPMPRTWSKKRKQLMAGTPHKQKPDKDNLEKGLLDALFIEDCGVWTGCVTKLWGYEGKIVIDECDIPDVARQVGGI